VFSQKILVHLPINYQVLAVPDLIDFIGFLARRYGIRFMKIFVRKNFCKEMLNIPIFTHFILHEFIK